jgi:alkylation response protein AidB-like acyl-CoA dehydrogenase
MIALAMGPPWPRDIFPVLSVCDVELHNVDTFHELILNDELSRFSGTSGVVIGPSIAIPPIMQYGSKELYSKVVGSVLRGEKGISLAITEPGAGSDVSNL